MAVDGTSPVAMAQTETKSKEELLQEVAKSSEILVQMTKVVETNDFD